MHKDHAINVLRPMVRTGMTFRTTTDHGRGMTDYVRVFHRTQGDITTFVAAAIGARLTSRGIAMGGCGYSKSFQVVYSLGRVMRPDFRCTGSRRCPSNDHVNEREADYRRGRRHSDGGYAFRAI